MLDFFKDIFLVTSILNNTKIITITIVIVTPLHIRVCGVLSQGGVYHTECRICLFLDECVLF